jgi:flagellar hook assembly protein FlgD
VEDAVDASDLTFSLSQNYPNPFNPETSISYQVPEASTVVLRIFNALGQEIRTLVNGQQAAGQYDIKWDGRDSAGIKVNSGVYLYRLEVISGKQKYVRDMKMLLLQ